MTISFPLEMPTSPSFTRVQIINHTSVGLTRSSFTHKTQVQAHPGKSWAFECSLPQMNRDEAEEWMAFFSSLNGQEGTFLFGNPASRNPRGVASGVPKVDGAHGAQGQVLVTEGWTASTTGILLKGDNIQLQNRLFKLLTNADSDGSGNATLDIWPCLREAIADQETIVTVECKGLFRLATNDMPLADIDTALTYGCSFSCIEAV